MPPSLWTDEQDQVLKREWPTGIPASQIACLIPGKSRNAIIGRAHRLSLGKRIEFIIKPPKKSPSPRKRKKRGLTPQEGAMIVNKKAVPPSRIPANKVLGNRPPISIMELNENTCRAIVGHAPNGLAVYCGDMTFAGKSFCEGHCALYFDYDRKRRYRS